jgi:hypothetical protein
LLDVKYKSAKESPAPRANTKAAEPRAPSAAVEHIAFQLITPPSTATKEEDNANAAANTAVSDRSSYGIIIEDDLPVGEGQVHRTEFMDHLAPLIESTAEQILSPVGRAARDCPYLSFWINYYRNQSAAHIERAIALYARPQRIDREGIEEAILDHVREAVQVWVDRRDVKVPGSIDWRVDDDHVPDKPSDGAIVQRMGADGHGAPAAPGSAAAIRGQLSAGRPLEPSVRTRMERGFGTSFSDVRLHTDSTAYRLAQQYSARAFTLGNHVAFGAGEYQPTTLTGQALMAHELAHVLQQRGASQDEGLAESMALESAADKTAARALLARTDPTPARSGLRLARCGSYDVAPRDWTTEIPPEAFNKAERLQNLQRERERILNQPGGNSQTSLRLAELDQEISQLAEELQIQGLQGDIGQVTQTVAQYGINALEVFLTGLTGDDPTELLWGERRRFDADVSFLPSNVDVNLTWKANNTFEDLDVGHNEQPNLSLALDEMFWGRWAMAEDELRGDGTLPNPQTLVMVAQLNVAGQAHVSEKRSQTMTIREAVPPPGQIELLAENVLSPGPPEGRPIKAAAPQPPPAAATSSISATGFGSSSSTGADGGVPAPSSTSGNPPPPAMPQVLQDAHMFFKLSWLAPGLFSRNPSYVIRWGVENLNWTRPDRFQVSLPDLGFWRCEFRFPDPGNFRVFAEIYQYPLTGAAPPMLASASSLVQVLVASEVGARALEAVTAGPAMPDYGGFLAELDAQINALTRVLAAGASNPDLYSKQVSDLQKMRQLLVNAMGQETALPFPSDENFDESKTYAAAMPAVLTHTDMRGAQPLTIYIRLQHTESGWQARLIDTTSKDVIYRTGSPSSSPKDAVASAIADWQSNNDYPSGGRVNYRFPRPAWQLAGDFSTSSFKKSLLEFLDDVIFIASAIIGTILLLVPEPTGATKALGLGLLAVSVLRSAYAIYHNIDMGRPVISQQNVLEGISILASLVGMRGGMMAARAATSIKAGAATARVLTTFRVGRGMVIASSLADAGTFVYVSVDTLHDLQTRANDPRLPAEQRDDEILRAIGRIALQGFLLVGSNRDLFRRPKGAGPRAAGGVVGALGGEVHLDPTQRSQMLSEIRNHGVHEDLSHVSDGDLARRYVDARQAYEVGASEALAAAPHGAVAGTGVYPMSASPNIRGPNTIRNAFGKNPGSVPRMPGVRQYDVVLGAAQTPATHLEIPVQRVDGSTAAIHAEVRFNLVDDISTIPGAHGPESGPARLSPPTKDATGSWRVEVTVDSRLGTPGNTPEAIRQVVGHELDEAAGIIRRSETDPSVAVDIPAQMRRGVFQPGSTGAVPTDHDVAAAHELADNLRNNSTAFKSADDAARSGTTPSANQRTQIAAGERSMNALLESMGFRDPATRPQKLLGLQAALGTVPPDLLRYIDHYGRMVEAQTIHAGYQASAEFAGTSLTTTNLTPELIDHLIHANAERGILAISGGGRFVDQGIAGAHSESALYDYVASQTITTPGGNTRPQYQVSVVREKSAGGTTYRMHAQFEREPNSIAPPPPRDMTSVAVTIGPNGSLSGVPYQPGWTTSRPPKTTASNLPGMLSSLDVAFAKWLTSPAGQAFAAGGGSSALIGQVGGTRSMTGLHGVEFGGKVTRVNGTPTLTSAWIEANWF